MARGRMISTTISADKRFNALSLDAALVYLMAIPQLDRDGLIHGDPVLLWAKVCPRRQDLMSQMQRIVNEWVEQELVSVYQDRDELVAYFVGFQKNQAMTHYDREAPSIFATPPGYVRTAKGLVPDEVQHDDKPLADQLRTNSGLTPDEVPTNVIEGKVNIKEIEGNISLPNGAHPKPPKVDVTEQQAMFGAIVDTCQLDANLQKSQIGKTASALLKAGYTPEQVRGFTDWWLSDSWRMEHTPVPTIQQLTTKILQFRNGVTTANGHTNGNGRMSKVQHNLDAVDTYFAMKEAATHE